MNWEWGLGSGQMWGPGQPQGLNSEHITGQSPHSAETGPSDPLCTHLLYPIFYKVAREIFWNTKLIRSPLPQNPHVAPNKAFMTCYGTVRNRFGLWPGSWHKSPKSHVIWRVLRLLRASFCYRGSCAELLRILEFSSGRRLFCYSLRALLVTPKFMLRRWFQMGPLHSLRMGMVIRKTKWWNFQLHPVIYRKRSRASGCRARGGGGN